MSDQEKSILVSKPYKDGSVDVKIETQQGGQYRFKVKEARAKVKSSPPPSSTQKGQQ